MSAAPKFTPGPWEPCGTFVRTARVASHPSGRDGVAIADCYITDGVHAVGERAANVALIAAAPDLYAALRDIVASLAEHDDEGMIEHAAQMMAARAALARVESAAYQRDDAIRESAIIALLGGSHYMDPPDGGDVSLLEQLRRMAEDAAKWRKSEAAR